MARKEVVQGHEYHAKVLFYKVRGEGGQTSILYIALQFMKIFF